MISAKILLHRSYGLHRVHFHRHNFNFNRNYDFNRRGWRSWFQRPTPDDMVLGLIIANVAIFLLWRIADEKLMKKKTLTRISMDFIKHQNSSDFWWATLPTDMLSNSGYCAVLRFCGSDFRLPTVQWLLGCGFAISMAAAIHVTDTRNSLSFLHSPSFFAETKDRAQYRHSFLITHSGRVLCLLSPATTVASGASPVSWDNLPSGRLHTFITNAFCHVDTWHMISYMVKLYFFGRNDKRPMILSKGLGASGAVNAVMLLDIFLFPKATIHIDMFFPVPAVFLGIFLIGKDMLRIIKGDSTISGSAQLGGAAVAAIAWAGFKKGRFY
ncbi:RHOMBOID-like protein 12, mitochondrial [Abrus precatorius]|uniref:RHOMBOID-like protein 12, mitochondrial n=1 Tax=Abrus precatorius TaxID=3816 RepID=A0A8B8MJP9_ABRPR|nr:RHOMBOID-like protein 12, mitochondrial [Abrus precatorius]